MEYPRRRLPARNKKTSVCNMSLQDLYDRVQMYMQQYKGYSPIKLNKATASDLRVWLVQNFPNDFFYGAQISYGDDDGAYVYGKNQCMAVDEEDEEDESYEPEGEDEEDAYDYDSEVEEEE